ncbi:MAG: hypothetical protein ACRCVN_05940 [Spirochaetia bacterium]
MYKEGLQAGFPAKNDCDILSVDGTADAGVLVKIGTNDNTVEPVGADDTAYGVVMFGGGDGRISVCVKGHCIAKFAADQVVGAIVNGVTIVESLGDKNYVVKV